ncbi:hypothetical protein [Flagellimonas myxillae]|uniref:hypothetical protein n=1 Tax=Flagellimonas myxillae TaxID=2942214 RepID=UPI00201F78F8|nr:hypothetical protein [Muricauda myxillae]MCL6265054.1 hypothetical protein [Muricauda myxillae]
MRTLFTIIGFLLLNASITPKMDSIPVREVLVDGNVATNFNQIPNDNGKPKMVVFYSSQHCGPCLDQLESLQDSIAVLETNYQLVFVDSWTLGKAKHQQDSQYAINFYENSLKTEHSIFLLDPEDKLLLDFQQKETLQYGLPYMAVQNAGGFWENTSFDLLMHTNI